MTSTNAIEEQCPSLLTPRAAPELICQLIGHVSNSTMPLVRSRCNRASRREFGTKIAISKQLTGGPYGLGHGPVNQSSTVNRSCDL